MHLTHDLCKNQVKLILVLSTVSLRYTLTSTTTTIKPRLDSNATNVTSASSAQNDVKFPDNSVSCSTLSNLSFEVCPDPR